MISDRDFDWMVEKLTVYLAKKAEQAEAELPNLPQTDDNHPIQQGRIKGLREAAKLVADGEWAFGEGKPK